MAKIKIASYKHIRYLIGKGCLTYVWMNIDPQRLKNPIRFDIIQTLDYCNTYGSKLSLRDWYHKNRRYGNELWCIEVNGHQLMEIINDENQGKTRKRQAHFD